MDRLFLEAMAHGRFALGGSSCQRAAVVGLSSGEVK
jgi:hypothetical protein